MVDLSPQERRNLKRFDAALATRQFEIDLFWKKSLFFWGFIGVAFVAVVTVEGKSRILSLLVSGFGVVCSFGWTLVNRGGKYWQEHWESRIEAIEDSITGPLFKEPMPPQDKGWWLSAIRYSVSKLAIAVSDYVFLVWVAVFLRQIWLAFGGASGGDFHLVALILICLVPVFYIGLLAWFAKSTPPSPQ